MDKIKRIQITLKYLMLKEKSRKKQGRNFGLKSGGTTSEGERGALWFQGEWGGSIPLFI